MQIGLNLNMLQAYKLYADCTLSCCYSLYGRPTT